MSLILDMLGVTEPDEFVIDDPELAEELLSVLTEEEKEKARKRYEETHKDRLQCGRCGSYVKRDSEDIKGEYETSPMGVYRWTYIECPMCKNKIYISKS